MSKKKTVERFKRVMPPIPVVASLTEGPVPTSWEIKGKPMQKPKGKK